MPADTYSLLAVFTAAAMALFFPAAAYSFTTMRLPRKREELQNICQALRLSSNLKSCPYGLFKTYEDTSILDYALPILFCSIYSFVAIWLLFDSTFYTHVLRDGTPNFLLQRVEHLAPVSPSRADGPGKITLTLGGETYTLSRGAGNAEADAPGNAPQGAEETAGALSKANDETRPDNYAWGSLLVVLMAGLGCYVWSIQYIGRRLSALDLTPNAFFAVATRMVYASFIALAVRHLLPADVNALPSIAFFIGMFPQRGMRLLREKMARTLGAAQRRRKLPLDKIDGIDLFTKTRLSELGVDNAQNLAEANFVEMLLRTPYNPWKIMDWITQAKLYVHAPEAMEELRDRGIRTVFDFLAVTDDKNSELCASGTATLSPQAVGDIRTTLERDPSVALLGEIRRRITLIPGEGKASAPPALRRTVRPGRARRLKKAYP